MWTIQIRIDTSDNPPMKLRPYQIPIHLGKSGGGSHEGYARDRGNWTIQILQEFPNIYDWEEGWWPLVLSGFPSIKCCHNPLTLPLQLIDDIQALLGKATCFLTLDLRSGYCHMILDNANQERAAFAKHLGLFISTDARWIVSCAISIHPTESIGREWFAMASLDDVLIFSRTREEDFKHLQRVYDRLGEHGLTIKLT